MKYGRNTNIYSKNGHRILFLGPHDDGCSQVFSLIGSPACEFFAMLFGSLTYGELKGIAVPLIYARMHESYVGTRRRAIKGKG